MSEVEDWRKSGRISAEAREYGKRLCKPGVSHLEIAEKIEEKMRQLGGKPAFPVDVSINTIAAHASPFPKDPSVLQEGELVKIDLGAHVNGYVTDTAATVEIGGGKRWALLIKAAEDGLKAALAVAKPGVAIGEIGREIEQAIRATGFSPVRNLSGHGVGQWDVHVSPSIPNVDTGDPETLEGGMHIAIEPFASTGEGFVKDGKPAGIYGLVNKRPVRLDSARKLLAYIEEEFKTLPFSIRWVQQFPNVGFLLALLEREGIIMQYPQLPERSGGMVSQAEHTIEVGYGVLTKSS